MKKIIVLILCIILVLMMSLSYAAKALYTDVTTNHWAYTPINYMTSNGFVNGYLDGSYRPENYVTRAEFSKILVKFLDLRLKDEKKIEYIDVFKDYWAYHYIKIASNFLDGYSDSKDAISFRPGEAIKREDVATAIVKALGIENESYSRNTLNAVVDKELISTNLQKYIAIAIENRVMTGNTNCMFSPQGYLTRAELAQVFYNVAPILENKKEQLSKELEEKKRAEQEKISGEKAISGDEKIDEFDSKASVDVSTDLPATSNNVTDKITKTWTMPSYNVSLTTLLGETYLADGRTYALYGDDEINATINNASDNSNFIYYMFSYGDGLKTTEVKKVSSSNATIKVPNEIESGYLKMSIWGASIRNNKSYTTQTEVFYFNYLTTSRIPEKIEEAQDEGTITTLGIDFITVFNGDTLPADANISGVKNEQKVVIRGKPVKNVKAICYRWDKEEYTTINGATATITIPKTFEPNTKHKLTVKLVDLYGNYSRMKSYTFEMTNLYQ